jgi:phage shock protein A
MYMRKSLSFDMDAIMGLTKEQLEGYLRVNEQEIIELLDLNKELLRRVKDLERDIEYYKGHIKDLESIKVEAKASKSVWRTIAALCGAVGAFIASLFFRRED